MVLSPGEAAPTRWTPSSEARRASSSSLGPKRSCSPRASPAWRKAVPYSGPAAPPTVETKVRPAIFRSWPPLASPTAPTLAMTAVNPRCMFTPWSASPMAASSWVRKSRSASRRAATSLSQRRTQAASTKLAAFRRGPDDEPAHGTATAARAILAPGFLHLDHGGRVPGRLVDLVEAGTGSVLECGDHRALHDRGLGDADPVPGLLLDQLVDGQLGREHGRPQVDQDQHPVALVGGGDRLGDQGGVGPDAAVVGAARGLDAHALGHLAGQLDHALGDLGRMGHDHQANAHGPSTSRPEPGSVRSCRTPLGHYALRLLALSRGGRPCPVPRCGLGVAAPLVLERDLEPGAVGPDPAVLDLQVELDDLGDPEVPEGLGRRLDRGRRRLLPGLGARPDELGDPIDAVGHGDHPSGWATRCWPPAAAYRISSWGAPRRRTRWPCWR